MSVESNCSSCWVLTRAYLQRRLPVTATELCHNVAGAHGGEVQLMTMATSNVGLIIGNSN
jgi:hypothetical protein